MGLYILPIVHEKSSSSGVWQSRENEKVPLHAWTTYVAADEEVHLWRALINHLTKPKGTWNLSVYHQVRQLVLRADMLRCPTRHGKSMFMSWSDCDVGIFIHPDRGIMKVHNNIPCESCKSVTRKFATNCVSTTYFVWSYWPNTTLAQWLGGQRGWNCCKWYLQQILCTWVLESFSIILNMWIFILGV